jgi:multiple sugar transport system substrate-binding protein
MMAMSLTLTAAVAETTIAEAPPAKDGETVVEFWCQMFEGWNQDWVTHQVYSWNAREDRPFYVKLTLVDGAALAEMTAAARAADTMPDVINGSYGNVANDYNNGYILDLKQLIPQSSWDDLLDSAREFITVGDAYVAYPWMLEPAVVMYYDKDAFAEVGLDPDSPPTTWEELVEYAKLLTTPDRFGVDVDLTYNFWGWMYTANDNQYLLTDDWSSANIDSQGMRDLAEFYRSFRNDGYASQTPLKFQNEGVYAVLEGRSAIAFSGSWGVGGINTDYPEKINSIGVAAAPTKDGSPFRSTSGGWSFVVDAHSDHPQESADFINYMLGSTVENVADFFVAANFSKFTTRKSVAEYLVANTAASTDERIQTIQSDIMPYVIAEPIYPWEITQYGLNMLASVSVDGVPIDDAIAEADKLINAYISDNGLAGKNPKAQ